MIPHPGGKTMDGIGKRIYEERKKKGLSQGELAEKLDVSAKAVSKWETGEAQPTLDNVARLAEIYEVSTDYLLKGAEGASGNKAPHLHYLEPQKETRHRLRIWAWATSLSGCLLVSSGFAMIYGLSPYDTTIWGGLTILGSILAILGCIGILVCPFFFYFGYIGAVKRYTAGEMAPVQKDQTNYWLDGTRDETGKTVKEIVTQVKGETLSSKCPKCGASNDSGALYCDQCGAVLAKRCRNCGEINAVDAKHCRQCGKSLD